MGRPGVQGGLEVVKGTRAEGWGPGRGVRQTETRVRLQLAPGAMPPPQEPSTTESPLAEHTACREAAPKSRAPLQDCENLGSWPHPEARKAAFLGRALGFRVAP